MKKFLNKQVITAIDNLHIKKLRDSQTDTIIMTVAELMTHIFASYGLVDATTKSKEEQNVSLLVLKINDPPVVVYNTVKELVDLSTVDNVPNKKAQILNIGMEMILKT